LSLPQQVTALIKMPNWVRNHVVITGPLETLELFVREKLSFQKFHPRAEEDYEDWYNWNTKHWGTKWEPDNMIPFIINERLIVQFDSAWAPPTAFFIYLTHFYENVTVTNRFADESFIFVGRSTISKGVAHNESIEPNDYTFAALEDFAKTNTWYEHGRFMAMVHSLSECYDESECKCLNIDQSHLKTMVVSQLETIQEQS